MQIFLYFCQLCAILEVTKIMEEQNQQRRVSDIEFSLDKNLNITWANRSFSMLFNTTNNNLNLADYIDEADVSNFKHFLKNYSSKNNTPYTILKLKFKRNSLTCVLFVSRKQGSNFYISLQELSYAQTLMDKTMLKNREYSALLSKFNSYFISYNGSKYALICTKDMKSLYLGKKEDFIINFIDFFEINTEIDGSKYQLQTLFQDIEDGITDRKYRLLLTDGTHLLVTTMRSSARKSYAIIGLVTQKNAVLSDNSYSEKRDGLTGLYNKQAITDLAIKKIDIARQSVALLIIDVDKFKEFNDNFGHAYGDKVLITVSKVMQDTIGDQGVAGRIGGDEFLCVLDKTDEKEIRDIARNIKMGIQWSIQATDPDQVVTCSIGIARAPENAETYDDLFMLADKCLYIAKKRGRNCYIIYKPEIHGQLLIEQKENERSTASGKYYMEGALSEMNIMSAIIHKEDDYIEKSLYMLMEYMTVHKICVYTWNAETKSYKTEYIIGKDEVDIRLKHLNDASENYLKYLNAYGFLHLDNINNLDTMDKDRFHMYLEDNVASTLEILCKSHDEKERVLICLDIYKPSRTFQAQKIVFALMAAKLISHELYSTIEV